jgi:hypothetical protein
VATLQVKCITRDNADLDQRIDAIGGDGFYRLIDDAISDIQNNIHIYYTLVNGQVAILVVKKHPVSGRLFLQTIADNYPHNNLLSLPECR